MSDSCENLCTNLYSAALAYHDWGWSLLPVRGDLDPENPKAAAVRWSSYQRRKPTRDELDSWFSDGRFTGLGIVCGRVSRLAVLDFDDAACVAAFANACPDLMETYTVESGVRGLPHYYYHVPDDVRLRGQRVGGADLQFESTYVIAPPTAIAGTGWQVVNAVEPHTLSQSDAERISRFLVAWRYASQKSTPDMLSGLPCVDLEAVAPALDVPAERLSDEVLFGWYRRLANQVGRNNALFRVACLARDCGWSRGAVLRLMLDVHTVQPATHSHEMETPVQRRQEGTRTIHSAFGYVARPRQTSKQAWRGLPNAIREALLQLKKAPLARVLEGLRLAGIEVGQVITERVACQLLRIYNIGRRAVQTALKTLNANGEAIFESPPNPPKAIANAANAGKEEQKKCLFVTRAKRVKKGRPARQFVVPDNQKLYQLFNVRPTGSDPLSPADLRSPNVYRQALHRALIERRPGLYSRRWLCARLGISVWTSRRYDRKIGLDVAYTHYTTRITWANVEEVPHYQAYKDGLFLECPDGKRYPPIQGLAKRLLQRYPYLIRKRQHWNYYRLRVEDDVGEMQVELAGSLVCEIFHKQRPVDQPDPIAATSNSLAEVVIQPAPEAQPALDTPVAPEPQPASEPERPLWVCPDCMKIHLGGPRPGACTQCGADRWEAIPEAVWSDPERCRTRWRAMWHARPKKTLRPKPMGLTRSQQNLVEKLYMAVRARTPARALTHAAARQLVLECGEVAVERALVLLDERHNVYNAAGFMITVLRGTSGSGGQKQAQAAKQSHQEWVAQLKASPYAQFYANEV